MKGTEANITLRIISQLISATLDKDGEVIEGDLVEVTDVNDVWTFARDTRSRDPELAFDCDGSRSVMGLSLGGKTSRSSRLGG
jgi:hypothetical protein